jgi:3-hydroxyacyl-[acyl-carrier-protein] dehydratase
MLTFAEIQQILPHRYPFLLIDRVTEITDEQIVGYKNVTGNEEFFQGHFPGHPVMPGVLIVEACAQLGAVLLLRKPEFVGKIAFLTGLDGWRFRRQVEPGDTLTITVTPLQLRASFGRSKAEARVNGELAASGEILFAIGPASTTA